MLTRSNLPGRLAGAILFIGAIGATNLVCAQASVPSSSSSSGTAAAIAGAFSPSPAFAESPAPRGRLSTADVAEKVVASVVNISAEKSASAPSLQSEGQIPPQLRDDPMLRRFFGGNEFNHGRPQQRGTALGSGVIVSRDGLILTNNHVVENATRIRVTTSDGHKLDATVVGTDPKTDLAVIKVENLTSKVKPLLFGDSDRLRLGEVVLAIGDPFGVGETVTMGIVSAKGRAHMGLADYENFIQTDAAINPGNSGGALVNMRGELVGINTAILSRSGGNHGIGFAIPANMAKRIMNLLVRDGKVTRGWLGVAIQELDPDLASAMKLSVTRGVLVSDVTAKSPASKAGLRRGDVLLSVNGKETLTTARLRNSIAALGRGGKASLSLLRDGKSKTIEVTLGALPGADVRGNVVKEKAGILSGIQLEALDTDSRARFKIPTRIKHGLVVTQIAPGSAAADTGLHPGDVIVEANRVAVSTPEAFQEVYAKSKKSMLVLVYRQGSTLYVLLRK